MPIGPAQGDKGILVGKENAGVTDPDMPYRVVLPANVPEGDGVFREFLGEIRLKVPMPGDEYPGGKVDRLGKDGRGYGNGGA